MNQSAPSIKPAHTSEPKPTQALADFSLAQLLYYILVGEGRRHPA